MTENRILALDVGEKRIGVAVSDPLGYTAQGVETIQTKGAERDIARIAELADAYHTRKIVSGLPRNMDGSIGPQAQRVMDFVEALRPLGFDIRYEDERLTTASANKLLIAASVRRENRKKYVDKIAATYILQSFLDAGGWK